MTTQKLNTLAVPTNFIGYRLNEGICFFSDEAGGKVLALTCGTIKKVFGVVIECFVEKVKRLEEKQLFSRENYKVHKRKFQNVL